MTFSVFLDEGGMQGWTPTTVSIGGQPTNGAKLDGMTRLGVAASGTVGGAPLFLSCFGPKAEATTDRICRNVLNRFLTTGLPAGVVFQGPRLTVGNRVMTVPNGCRLVDTDTIIRCPHAELHWRDPAPGCRTTTEQQRQLMQRAFERVGQTTVERVRCTVMGSESDCDRWVLRSPGRAAATIFTHLPGCGGPTLQCNVLSGPATPHQTPCDQVFDAPLR